MNINYFVEIWAPIFFLSKQFDFGEIQTRLISPHDAIVIKAKFPTQ